jgi:plasmid stabilization system protein ParE
MVKRIVWTDTAVRKYHDIIVYYKQQDARKSAERFQKAVNKKIAQLEQQPYIGRPSPKFKTMRLLNIDEYRQMGYRIDGTTLYISNFRDMRQNPKKRPF